MPEFRMDAWWESRGAAARSARAVLAPLSWVYGAFVALRNRGYDAGLLPSYALGAPVVSIGNLTVGGTGKTPIAAWLAGRISEFGGRPAILLRGYGDDEPLVHKRLEPRAIVVARADRVAAAAEARAAGATVLVLDDGFQHRRAHRDADVVLVSADRHRRPRLLPAGPWREPLTSLSRATHIVVTRRRSTPLHAREVLAFTARVAPAAELAVAHLASDTVVPWGGGLTRPATWLGGKAILAVSGIADGRAFEAMLRDAGASVASVAFRDHAAYPPRRVSRLARAADGREAVVCTLKDAVKLGPQWPATAPPLWYLSQRVSIEQGVEALDGLARRLARSTPQPTPNAGRRRQESD